ncbi:MAG TPA: class I tRNA ligase family protein, partial [Candidatus Paceibacterota bacterium]|nr:class I tRNA ligase family protein [Candidatus Paceibacterota bacterium]
WFESGSMPFAEAHYPFETDEFDPRSGLFKKSKGYPADFIAEGLDQTRGWFYSMLVLGVALFGRSPYKNVVVNGLVLAEDGQKMAKSKNNYPPLMPTIEKYGADSLRYFFASSPAVKAEDVCFSEKGVDEVAKKLLQRLDNVLSFYELYAKKDSVASVTSQHVLDMWIRARLAQTIGEVTKRLDAYELDKAARPLMDFVDDLSNWYLRRSRDRFKGDNEQDKNCALSTIHFVLLNLSKIMAPFTPFYADYLYKRLHAVPFESVHLDMWPKTNVLSKEDEALIQNMTQVRAMVTLGLEARMKVKVNVRQPLSRLTVGVDALTPELSALIQDEVNVKQVIVDPSLKGTVVLDAVITPELQEEGSVREFIRFVQDMRKKDGFTVGDMRTLVLDTQGEGTAFVEKWKNEIMRANQLKHISYESPTEGSPLSLGALSFKIKII